MLKSVDFFRLTNEISEFNYSYLVRIRDKVSHDWNFVSPTVFTLFMTSIVSTGGEVIMDPKIIRQEFVSLLTGFSRLKSKSRILTGWIMFRIGFHLICSPAYHTIYWIMSSQERRDVSETGSLTFRKFKLDIFRDMSMIYLYNMVLAFLSFHVYHVSPLAIRTQRSPGGNHLSFLGAKSRASATCRSGRAKTRSLCRVLWCYVGIACMVSLSMSKYCN